eukprot:TRINITY_DN6610_c0_g1_i12.p1 TRINITY_DN6610_c0_g1~~TRINITY_DN6610_c0_g1_i12.p1  ORF type:complete len:201 (+),score=40.76 TRINITY_DN6610_c0_g1_i12:64-666(+)
MCIRDRRSTVFKNAAAYHSNVIDHYENPRNVGSLQKTKRNVGTGLVGAPACGDVMKLQIEVGPDGKTIEKAVFKTYGCGSAIASSSYATELITGMSIDEALNIKNSDIASYLKLPPVKLHCSMLAEDAIKKAIEDFKKKNDEVEAAEKASAHAASSAQICPRRQIYGLFLFQKSWLCAFFQSVISERAPCFQLDESITEI